MSSTPKGFSSTVHLSDLLLSLKFLPILLTLAPGDLGDSFCTKASSSAPNIPENLISLIMHPTVRKSRLIH